MVRLLLAVAACGTLVRGAPTFAVFSTSNSTINGTFSLLGGTLVETITGSAVISFPSTVTAGAPASPTIFSGTDFATHAVPGFPTTNFRNVGLLSYGTINTFQSTMYWGNVPGNSTGATDRATWTITYNFRSPLPAGIRIVLFDIGVSPVPAISQSSRFDAFSIGFESD